MKKKQKRSFSPRRISAGKVLKFCKRIYRRKFKKTSHEEKLIELVEKGLKMPKRATVENALQGEYRYTSSTRYRAKVLTAMINGKFNPRGSSWVHVEDEIGETVWTREFYKTKGLLERLLPYAIIAQNMSENRPRGTELIQIKETEYAWKEKKSRKLIPFLIEDYFTGLTEEEKTFVINHENKRDAYLIRTAGKVTRQREMQEKWK